MMATRRRGRSSWLLSLVAVGVVLAATASAQTLGELARQEEARRKTLKTPSKVITNDSVHAEPRPAPPSTAAPPVAPAQAATSAGNAEPQPKGAAANEDKTKPAPADPKKEEAAWRQRIQSERDAVQRAQIFAEALQSRINALTTDFTNRDDPAQRATIANDRQKALAELDRVKNEIAQHNKAIAAIQDEARRSGVAPGWLRP